MGADVVIVDFSQTSATADTGFKGGRLRDRLRHRRRTLRRRRARRRHLEVLPGPPVRRDPEPWSGGLPAGFSASARSSNARLGLPKPRLRGPRLPAWPRQTGFGVSRPRCGPPALQLRGRHDEQRQSRRARNATELAELRARLTATTDAARPEAVAKRRKTGQRTARENIADLVDDGSFVEYGALALAAQHARHVRRGARRVEPRRRARLRRRHRERRAVRRSARARWCSRTTTPCSRARRAAWGTRSSIACSRSRREWRCRSCSSRKAAAGGPNDTDMPIVAGLDTPSFLALRALSAASRRASASRRAAASPATRRCSGCCDVVIATEDSTIGMGGPAMIEGGGLGTFTPEEVGPIDVQTKSGVVDVRVARRGRGGRDREAVPRRTSTGPRRGVDAAPIRRRCATAMPERAPARVQDPADHRHARRHRLGARAAARLRPQHGHRARAHRGPSRSASSRTTRSTSAARSTPTRPTRPRASCSCATRSGCRSSRSCDTPGFMVGPKAEATALVRHVVAACSSPRRASRAVLHRRAAASGYGLGAQAMAGGHFHAPFFTVAWPTASSARWASRARCGSR